METARKDTLILGTGNLLLKDEGVGVHVVKRLEDTVLPEDVELLDGGTGGFDLLYEIEGRKKVILIDAVKAGETPGTIYRFSGEDIEMKPKVSITLHDTDFADVLHVASIRGEKPKITVIGIEPKDISMGLELSPEIERQIPKMIELVMKEIGSQEHK